MKKLNRFLFSGMGLAALLFLSGCVGRDKAGNPSGLIWDTIGQPMANAIQYFANNAGLGFGLAIIIVTLIVRILILPLGIYQSWKATLQSEKMNYLKPIFAPIQERVNNAESQEEKLAAQQELMAAQRANGVSMFGGIGCLPLLIQMPFFSALFFAAQYTPGVNGSSFLWIADLSQRDWILTAIVGVLYYIQSVLSLHGIEDETQKEQMRKAGYSSPIMIVFFSFMSPAAVTLYWVVGGFIQIIQQFIINYLIRPRLRKQVAEEFEKNPPQAMKSAGRKDVTPTAKTAIDQKKQRPKNNRNAGKQRSRK